MVNTVIRGVIVCNQVECLKCGDKPFSGHRHDFKPCKCGAVVVDGGPEYLRRVFRNHADYRELSIQIEKEKLEQILATATEAQEAGRNIRGIVYAVLRGCRDTGVLANGE